MHQDANSLLQAGILQDKNHDPKAAARYYARVLKLQPQNKYAWFDLGVAAQEVGDTADAHRAYERALTIDPAFPSALFNEALLVQWSKPDQAVALLERAAAANPREPTTHLHLGEIWARKDHERKAAAEFRRAVAIDPSLLAHVPEKFKDSARGH
ncbi:tetratricopeptide repeat protein [Streptomyces sp. NPDC051896]|uniref:tetratricopeptide repeat protein n=1 Tax=Streptomyces sp. NPDC051896 TaxID=3155416 RepID=UPI003419463F